MTGILYGVGVGPGDPELMTLKAVRMIRENDIIALPGAEPKETIAYRIAVAAVPELSEKKLIPIYMPMTHDKEDQKQYHRKGAAVLEQYLQQGKNVVFLTLGDPTVYSTFTYIQQLVEEDGYETRLINGVPSFCAAAARVNRSLGIWKEQIHIYPAVHHLEETLPEQGTCILMKSGSRMKEARELIVRSGRDAVMVEACGMKDEKIYYHAEEFPETAGYYSLIIAREAENK